MKNLSILACIVGLTFMSGCAETTQLLREANEFQAQQPQQRNYFTNPITMPPLQGTQPNFAPFGATSGEQYQTIMVNTPNGLVYKRCKVLNGQVVACF